MKANTKDAKIVPMVKMPLLGSVVPTFTHKICVCWKAWRARKSETC